MAKKFKEHDIVRLKGEGHHRLYEVTNTTDVPKGFILIRDFTGNKTVEIDRVILVTRKGNRYDYEIGGDFIE